MKIKKVTRSVLCVRCQRRYDLDFLEDRGHSINPGCRCGCVKYSYLPKRSIDSIVEANINVVYWVISHKIVPSFPSQVVASVGGQEELASEGMVALVEAAHHYDPTRRGKYGRAATFNTYAVTVIESRLSQWIHQRMRRGDGGLATYSDDGRYVRGCTGVACLSDLMGKGDGHAEAPIHDQRVPDPLDRLADQSHREQVVRAIFNLRSSHQKVIRLRFFCGMTLRQAGAEMGITGQRVRQLQEKAIQNLARMVG